MSNIKNLGISHFIIDDTTEPKQGYENKENIWLSDRGLDLGGSVFTITISSPRSGKTSINYLNRVLNEFQRPKKPYKWFGVTYKNLSMKNKIIWKNTLKNI